MLRRYNVSGMRRGNCAKPVLLASVIAIACILTATFVVSDASDDSDATTAGGIEWSVDSSTKVLKISPAGSGTNIGNMPMSIYLNWKSEDFTSVVIENGVKNISSSAFSGCTNLKTVTIADSVTVIDSYAFNECTALESITIGNGVKTIDSKAFYNCVSLKQIAIPASVTSIKEDAFVQCTAMEKFEIADGNTSYVLSDGALLTADKKTLISFPVKCGATTCSIPADVETICNYAFYNCDTIKSIDIPNNVKTIGEDSFSGCIALEHVGFGNSVKTIGERAFNGCTKITEIMLPDTVEKIGRNAFTKCVALATVDLGKGLKTIDREAFSECSSIESIVIPDSVTYLGEQVFIFNSNTSKLTSVTIGKNVDAIRESAFKNTKLTSVTIPSSVKSIDRYAFYNCPLESVNFEENSKLETIGDSAFYWCDSLGSIDLPDSLKKIGSTAFNGCTDLASVTFGESLETIGSYAFSGCKVLTQIILPDSLKTIEQGAFSRCSGLEFVKFSDNLADIGSMSFNQSFFDVPGDGNKQYGLVADDLKGRAFFLLPDKKMYEGDKGEDGRFSILDGNTLTVAGLDFGGVASEVKVTYPKYNGNPLAPTVTLTVGGKILEPGVDYDIECTKKTDVGDYFFKIVGKGGYSDSIEDIPWFILKGDQVLDVTAKGWVYGADSVTPTVTGNINDPKFTYASKGSEDYSETAPTDAGEYKVKVYVPGNANCNDAEVIKVFTIEKAVVTAPTIASKVYNGSTQIATVTDGSYSVTKNEGGINVGFYNVVLTVDSNHKWSDSVVAEKILQFEITVKDISDAVIALGDSLTYTGSEQTQQVASVTIDGLTVTYAVSGNVGTDASDRYVLTVTGTGNFTGTATTDWSIAPKIITGDMVVFTGGSYTYDGTDRTVPVTVTGLVAGVDYQVAGDTQRNAGSYQVTVTGIGNYTGEVTKDWSIGKAVVTAPVIGSAVYNGSTQTATVTSGDYTITENNGGTDVGSYRVILTVDSNHKWSDSDVAEKILQFEITVKDISDAVIALGDSLTYTGSEQTQQVASVTIDGLTVTYAVSGNVGTDASDRYVLTVTGIGNYAGEVIKDWSIGKAALTVTAEDKKVAVEKEPSFTYIVTGLIDGETMDSIGLTVTYDCGYTVAALAGETFAITPVVGTSTNYEVTVIDGTLTVCDGYNVETVIGSSASGMVVGGLPEDGIIPAGGSVFAYIYSDVPVTGDVEMIVTVDGVPVAGAFIPVSELDPSELPPGVDITTIVGVVKIDNVTGELRIEVAPDHNTGGGLSWWWVWLIGTALIAYGIDYVISKRRSELLAD